MFTQLLDAVVTSAVSQTNVIQDGEISITYGELPLTLHAIGQYLLRQQIDPTHCLALECPNSVPGALTILALMQQGISFCMLPQPQADQPDWKLVPQFCQSRISVKSVAASHQADWRQQPQDFLTIAPNAHFHPLPGGVEHGPRRVYLRTSGSMGTSKIVVHSQDNFVGNAHNCRQELALVPSDHVVIPIPLAHIYGLACAFLSAFSVGASIDLQSHTNHLQYLAREKSFQPNVAFLTPTLCELLLQGFSTPRHYKFAMTAGQRISDDLFRRFDAQIGGTLINSYGSSELGTLTTSDPHDPLEARITSIGHPLSTANLRIEQPDPATGMGELYCQNAYSFAGYVDETGAWLYRAAPNAWFQTGDLAIVTEAGDIRLVGRAQNSTNRSGYLVLFSDIERIMEQMDDIAKVVVVASAEKTERGQALVAFCVPTPGASLHSQQVRKACLTTLPGYAVPDEVRIMASLPLLPSGKVDQQALKKQAHTLFPQPASRRLTGQATRVEDVITTISYLIADELDVNIKPEEIDPDVALLREGLNLDSIALVRLTGLVKESFQLQFHDDALDMTALQSVRTLAEWIYARLYPQVPPKAEGGKNAPAPTIGYTAQHLRANVSLLQLRAATFGIGYYDLQEVYQNAHDPASWSMGFAKFAERHAAAAQQAIAAQQLESARQWWQMAVNYYHFTQLFLEGEQRNRYRTQCWQAYTQFAALTEPCCQRVAIPYKQITLPGYLRVRQPGAPCVIFLAGLELAKEVEIHQCAEYFLARGLSVLTLDGPGQGELAGKSVMRGDFESVVGAAIDFLDREVTEVDASRIGLFGISLGGYMVLRASAMERRVTACINLSGPFDGNSLRNIAAINQQAAARLFGFDTIEPLLDPHGPLNLANTPRAMTQPLLLIHGTLDHVVPVEQVKQIQAWAQGPTELWLLEDVAHCCFSRMGEIMPAAGDWLAMQLR